MRRVVVTGMGMVTPVGRDLESTWSALCGGKSGVGEISLFDARTFPTRIAAEVPDFQARRLPGRRRAVVRALAEQQVRPGRGDDGDQGLGAAGEAELDRTARFGVYLGSGEGQHDFPRFVHLVNRSRPATARVDTAEFTRLGVQELHPVREAEQEPGTPSGHLASQSSAPRGSTPTA